MGAVVEKTYTKYVLNRYSVINQRIAVAGKNPARSHHLIEKL